LRLRERRVAAMFAYSANDGRPGQQIFADRSD
jgi:hypothetical protein